MDRLKEGGSYYENIIKNIRFSIDEIIEYLEAKILQNQETDKEYALYNFCQYFITDLNESNDILEVLFLEDFGNTILKLDKEMRINYGYD